MGSFNGAEICNLIGLFLLNEIKKSKIFTDNEFGLYRDDGITGFLYRKINIYVELLM